MAPDSFTVTRGEYVSDGIPDLAESDNLDLSLRRLNSDIQSRTEFEVKAVSPTSNPASLEVTLEGAVDRSTVNQTSSCGTTSRVHGNWSIQGTRPTLSIQRPP